MSSRSRNRHILTFFSVFDYNIRIINYHVYITETYHEGKTPSSRNVRPKTKPSHNQLSDKLKQLRIELYKILDRLSDVIKELFHEMVPHFTLRNHLIPYYPEEPLLSLFLSL